MGLPGLSCSLQDMGLIRGNATYIRTGDPLEFEFLVRQRDVICGLYSNH